MRLRDQTQDSPSAEAVARQPKKGGNPYRQQLSRIFPEPDIYDYYEAADLDLGFSKL
ncbi:hypothetical protein [Neisseria elongata]|uniref:hypothetical protein n=1 Tax=Neisseria elongata TaxID=495 RepID=UPI0024B0ECD0|nr:hypothetical protein [Neisseria elongata]